MGESKRRRETARLADEIAKVAVEEGALIEIGYLGMIAVLGWTGKSEADKRDLKLAFYSGAQHLFASIMGIMDDDRELTEQDMRRMAIISDELDKFAEELKQLLIDKAAGQA